MGGGGTDVDERFHVGYEDEGILLHEESGLRLGNHVEGSSGILQLRSFELGEGDILLVGNLEVTESVLSIAARCIVSIGLIG